MVAGLLHLPTATWGGRMGLYLLSTLVLSGSTPFGIMASRSAELNSDFLVQDKPHKLFQCALPAFEVVRPQFSPYMVCKKEDYAQVRFMLISYKSRPP